MKIVSDKYERGATQIIDVLDAQNQALREEINAAVTLTAPRPLNGLALQLPSDWRVQSVQPAGLKLTPSEAGLVIEGVLDLWGNGAHHVLKRGDSFSFPSTRVHRCANTSARTTRVLWVITPPHY